MRSEQDHLPSVLREAAKIVNKADARYDNLLYPPNWPRMMREFLQQYPDDAIRIVASSFGAGIGIGAMFLLGVRPGFVILTTGCGLGFGQMAVEIRKWSLGQY